MESIPFEELEGGDCFILEYEAENPKPRVFFKLVEIVSNIVSNKVGQDITKISAVSCSGDGMRDMHPRQRVIKVDDPNKK